jgi:hypothetical protein
MVSPQDIRVGDIQHLDSTPPEGATPQSVMTLQATVEVKPQELKIIRPYDVIKARIPGSLSSEAQEVLRALFACFEKQNSIKEGIVGDMIWGFEQACVAPDHTLKGMLDLCKEGYLKIRAPDSSLVTLYGDRMLECWVSYEPKLLNLVY